MLRNTYQSVVLVGLAWSVALAAGAADGSQQPANEQKSAKELNNAAAAQLSASPINQPIKGFHPIKKLMQPLNNLQKVSDNLQQSVTKLEVPISHLQPPMIKLQHKMVNVDETVGDMQKKLTSMQAEVVGVRKDVANVRRDMKSLKDPIVDLQEPVSAISKPIAALEMEMNLIIGLIVLMMFGIAIGTPLTAILLYRNRSWFFRKALAESKDSGTAAKEVVTQNHA